MSEPTRVGAVLLGVLAEVIDRANNRYDRWAEQVAAAGYCAHPIRLNASWEWLRVLVDEAHGHVS
jgi:hypothetical protein